MTGINNRVRARMPLPDEIEVLRVPAGVPVLTITRRTYAGDRVVEVAVDITLPADRDELEYDIDLSGGRKRTTPSQMQVFVRTKYRHCKPEARFRFAGAEVRVPV